ncbi:23950_t:CDS:2 [Gigaspora margarita]|uniref:23950_t:CDS:1 n=1 Tax=Gigaspora margarita TaxID=4874 RepID=A0ABN7V608_GIGMA|nr:23950_t:CDS:2 [Gigaspora margarita]
MTDQAHISDKIQIRISNMVCFNNFPDKPVINIRESRPLIYSQLFGPSLFTSPFTTSSRSRLYADWLLT